MTKKKKPEPKPTPPVADIAGDHSATLAHADGRTVFATPIGPAGVACPTCGTAKTGNRCDVCGHQERDT